MPDMSKDSAKSTVDLYSIHQMNLPKVDPAEGKIAPIVEAALNDYDSEFAQTVADAGICDHPQLVVAMVATSNSDYISLLLTANPELGVTLVYGGLLLRNTEAFINMLELVSDELLFSSKLDDRHLKLLIDASKSAIDSRSGADLDPGTFTEELDRFRSISSAWLKSKGSVESFQDIVSFQSFSRYRELLDQINLAVSRNSGAQEGFYSDVEPTIGNYLKATYGLLAKNGSQLQREASEFFQRLDPPLFEGLRFGLEHGNYTNNQGPRKI
ncbi:MAG: hypothetical protein RL518_282 [Pseudomonadota bacterium]|jgi:hypothetical protein